MNEIEINMYLYKVQKYLIPTKDELFNVYDNSDLKLLFDNNNNLLAISKYYSTVKSLAVLNKKYCESFKYRNVPENFSHIIKKNECWKYKLVHEEKIYSKKTHVNSVEELEDFILINQKSKCMDAIQDKINYAIKNETCESPIQQQIYFSKYLEAKEILKNNVVVDEFMQYPYTRGYSNINQITLQEAAKMILTQHEILSDCLSEFENIRLKYKKKILKETDLKNLNPILEQFYTEFDRYSHL
jgi:hypothetical protein